MKNLYDYLFGSDRLKLAGYGDLLEEYCDANNIDIDNIDDLQLDLYYYRKAQDSHVANAKENFLANIDESLTSHSGQLLAQKLEKIIGSHGYVRFNKTDIPHTIFIKLNDDYLLQKHSYVDFILSDTPESDKIYYMLRMFNYHITEISKDPNNGSFIIVEPMYSKNVTNKLRSKTDIFYHVTSKSNINKILKRGLTPKVGKTRIQGGYRYFPDKVFLIASSKNIIDDIKQIIKNKGLNDKQYAIIKIDLSGHNVGLYKDDYYGSDNIIYTYEAIPTQLLTVIENIDDL